MDEDTSRFVRDMLGNDLLTPACRLVCICLALWKREWGLEKQTSQIVRAVELDRKTVRRAIKTLTRLGFIDANRDVIY